MGVYDECYAQLSAALDAWDFSSIWPSGYTGVKSVVIAEQWPQDLIDNMLNEGVSTPVGSMTQPIISIVTAHGTGSFRTLGGNYYDPNNPGATLKAERFGQAFMISSWADQLLGGYDTCMRLAGQVAGCLLANRTSLPSYRQLKVASSDVAYEDKPGLWVYDQHVEGITVNSVTL